MGANISDDWPGLLSPLQEGDSKWMGWALELAERGWGTTHPNPMVGCVIVRDNKVVSEGWHERAGGAHAEVVALDRAVPEQLKGATLYVTLEPCSTVGRTGACTKRIIGTGVERVVIAMPDPNPDHQGRAIRLLHDAGIKVSCGCLLDSSRRLNWIFNHWITYNEPLFALKVASTLDGKVATQAGHSQWITDSDCRQDVMRWRALFPVIAVGAGTVEADDPALTVRISGQGVRCPAVRLILDRSGKLAGSHDRYQVFTDPFATRTVWVTGESVPEASEGDRSFAHWRLPDGEEEFWQALRNRLTEKSLVGVWFEGGPRIWSSLLRCHQADALWLYQAPTFLADDEAPTWCSGLAPATLEEGMHLADLKITPIGNGVRWRGLLPNRRKKVLLK